MPKEKHSLKHPWLDPKQKFQTSDDVVANLLKNEKKIMISRTIHSGKKHGLNLMHGSPNPGTGDCAFESVISNINDRLCFPIKFVKPVDYYRKIWVTEMASRTLNSSWNIYSPQQWIEAWREMLLPGAYERGIFGDLMLPGIACGKKNTF